MYTLLIGTVDESNEDEQSALNHRNNKGATPLVEAIEHDFPALVKTLIAAGSSLKEGMYNDEGTVLHVAASMNRASCLEVMSEGEDCNLAAFKKMLVVKDRLKMIPVMVTEDSTCIEVS